MKRRNLLRILSVFLVLIFAITFASCKKEIKSDAKSEKSSTTQKETTEKGTTGDNDTARDSGPLDPGTSTPSNSGQTTVKPKPQVHTHTYTNYKCTGCGQMDKENMFYYFKDWVIEKGVLNGDYVYYSNSAGTYGGYTDEKFSLYYWGDTDVVEFCLHSVLDDDYSINFYIYIPKNYTGNYEYLTSYYYRDTGVGVCESEGVIEGKNFTKNYPLNSNKYTGSATLQNDFMEMSRVGICDALDCLKQFLQKEQIGYTWQDLGFQKF